MPYVPSKKTDGKSRDRELLDVAVENVAREIAEIPGNFELLRNYKNTLVTLGQQIEDELGQLDNGMVLPSQPVKVLAKNIVRLGDSYGYEGAFLGELNYAVTRLIQRVPQLKVVNGEYEAKSELRYWLYACTTQALVFAASYFVSSKVGVGGVFEDIKDEYKRRVNTAYEAAQIVKSGDCYDTPYYTRLVEVVDQSGGIVGYMEVMMHRSERTRKVDVVGQIVGRDFSGE